MSIFHLFKHYLSTVSSHFYMIARRKISRKQHFRKLMNRTDVLVNDIGSILNGYEACECGLIDEMGGLSAALAALRTMIAEAEVQK